jgi:hypothetical protein
MMRSVAATLALYMLAGASDGRVMPRAPAADGTGSSLIGTLTAYDPATRILTLATADGQRAVVLAKTAQVRQGSRLIKTGELSKYVGSRAKVRYTASRGTLTAESVMLSVAPG